MLAADKIQPLGQRILVRRYERPKTISEVERDDGSTVEIVRSDAWREDRSFQLFEVVEVGPRANENLKSAIFVYHDDDLERRTELAPDDILKMSFAWQMVDSGLEGLWFVKAADVRAVHIWKEANGEYNDPR